MSYPTVRQTPSTHASSFSGRSLSICCTSLQRHAAVARKCDNETNQPPVGLQSRPMWPVAAVRSMERSVGDQRVVSSSQSQFLLETYCAPQECRVQTVQFAGCRLPRKPPPTLCGLRSAVWVRPPIPNSSSCWASPPSALICSLGLIRAAAVLYQFVCTLLFFQPSLLPFAHNPESRDSGASLNALSTCSAPARLPASGPCHCLSTTVELAVRPPPITRIPRMHSSQIALPDKIRMPPAPYMLRRHTY